MIYKGTSILGDQKYRKRNMKFKKIDKRFEEILNSFKGQVLHASTLGFHHPRNLKKIEFKTKLPFKFKKLVDVDKGYHFIDDDIHWPEKIDKGGKAWRIEYE